MTQENYPFADNFPWEWYLVKLGLSARRAEPKKDWAYIPECDDRKTGIRDLEELVEFRLETGLEVWSLDECEVQ